MDLELVSTNILFTFVQLISIKEGNISIKVDVNSITYSIAHQAPWLIQENMNMQRCGRRRFTFAFATE